MDVSTQWEFKTMIMVNLHPRALAGYKHYLCRTPHNLYKSLIIKVLTLTLLKKISLKMRTHFIISPTQRLT